MTPNTHHCQSQLAFSENLTAVVVALTVALSVTFSAAANAQTRPAAVASEGGQEVSRLPAGWEIAPIGEPTIVPAKPEDPTAPAFRYTEPTPVPAGDEAPTDAVTPALKGNPYRLSFVNGDYAPPIDERIDPRLLDHLARSGVPHTWGYVMFEGAVQARKVMALEKLGLVFRTHQPFNSIQAWIPASAIPALRVHPFVRWVGHAKPHQKIGPTIAAKLAEGGADAREELPIFVHSFESDLGPWSTEESMHRTPPPPSNDPKLITMPAMITKSNGPIQRRLENAGARVYAYEDILNVFFVWANRETIRRLCDLDIVAGMDFAHTPEMHHDRTTRMTGADYLGAQASFSGKDTAVAVVDTGIHKPHLDFFAKYVLAWDLSGENNAAVDNCGHGTKVAGTLCGAGLARVDKRFRGSAPLVGTVPEYTLMSIKLTRGDCNTLGVGWPNTGLFAWSRTVLSYPAWNTQTKKVTVVNNSWGYPTRGQNNSAGTDTLSLGVDSYTHLHRQLYVVSVGNSGGNASGQNYGVVTAPATSKTALTVGNVMDYDDTSVPINGNRYPGAAAYSSSKGPTSDGRIKPEISAPGNMSTSAKTNTLIGYDDYGGSSAAAPHVSGIAASLHDFSTAYRDYPCLVRAKMMASSAPYAGTRTFTQTSESYYNRRGMGQVDAYHTVYQNDKPGGWKSGAVRYSLTRSSSGAYFDITIPSDARRTMFVLSWDEKPAALNAPTPVLYDFDLLLDVEPFDRDINKGEYWSRRKGANYEFYGNVATINAIRGKKVRVKIPFLKKPTSGSEIVRLAVAYHIPRGDYTPSVSVALTGVPTVMQPSTPFTATATVTTPAYRANNIYGELSAPIGTPQKLTHRTRDGRYLDTDQVVSPTDSLRNWTLGNVDILWPTASRRFVWSMKAPNASGVSTIRVTVRGDNAGVDTASKLICVDGLAPNPPTRVASSTHKVNGWSNNRNFAMSWAAARDNGCAGIDGYGVNVSGACVTPPAMTQGVVTTFATAVAGGPAETYYASVRAFDRADNRSTRVCIGPFWIDTVAPTGTINIDSGNSTTRSLSVQLSLKATDAGAGSGVARMQLSNDGITWPTPIAYATTVRSWMLAAGAPGVRTVWVRFIDVAGNRSSSVRDTIVYNPFSVRSVSPNRGPLIGGDKVTITGTGFTAAAPTVLFGTTKATGVTIVDDNTLTCIVPTNLTAGLVDVAVGSGAYTGSRKDAYEYVGGRVTATGQPQVGVSFPITFEALVDGGRNYAAAASLASGAIPLVPHNPLRLAPDALFFLTSGDLLPTVFGGFRGVIGAGGTANGFIHAPNEPQFAGLNVYVAFVTVDATKPLGIRTVSAATRFQLQP